MFSRKVVFHNLMRKRETKEEKIVNFRENKNINYTKLFIMLRNMCTQTIL